MLSIEEIKKLAGKKDSTVLRTLGENNFNWIDFIDPKTNMPCLPLEYLWGARGMVAGRMLKIEAEEGIGKSSYMMLAYGMGQRSKANCLHLEGENAIAPRDFIASFGCNPDRVITAELKTRSIEACFNEIDQKSELLHTADPGSPIMVGVDSISSFGSGDSTEDAAIDLGVSDGGMGNHARFLSRWFRDRWSPVTRRNVFLMAIAQLREKISIGPMAGRGKTKTTIAARPLDYYSSFRIEMSSSKLRDRNDNVIGENVALRTTKNKLSHKGKMIRVPLIWDQGFDMNQALLDILTDVSKSAPLELPSGREFKLTKDGGWIKCPLLLDKAMRTTDSAEFAAMLYSNTEVLMELREALKIRGFGFQFESRYDGAFDEDEDEIYVEPAADK